MKRNPIQTLNLATSTPSLRAAITKPFFTLLAFTLLSLGFTAHAANRYALTCIVNNTQDSIHLDYAWGDDHWQALTIEPGATGRFYYEFDYANQNSAPKLYISFDSDLTGDDYWIDYTLEQYAAPDVDCDNYGSLYGLEYDSASGYTIALFDYNDLSSAY